MLLIISEIANAHEGQFEKAVKMIQASVEAGVDAVKMQKFTAEELLVPQHSRYQHFKNLEMPEKEWIRLAEMTQEYGLKFYCDIFGAASFEFACRVLKCDGIKIHSSDLGNEPLLKHLRKWSGQILLSCGGATELEIWRALEILSPVKDKVVLMHGFQNFPTSLEETNLNRLGKLSRLGLPVGYMDHVDAEDPMAMVVPLLAVAAGATVIEKHITLDRSLKGIDFYSSFHPDEMKKLVHLLKDVRKTLGAEEIIFGPEENSYRKKMKKHMVASRAMSPGEILKEEDISYKRVETDRHLLSMEDIIGKPVKNAIAAQEALKYADFDLRVGILIIARMKSTRLPGKVLIPILNKPSLQYLIERTKLSKTADTVVLCTTADSEDDALANLAEANGIACFRGSELDVLERMLGACTEHRIDIAVRVTGDDIFLSPEHLDQAVTRLLNTNADYCHNKGLPSGTECEVFTVQTLRRIHRFAEDPNGTEYLSYFIENESFQKEECPIPEHLRRRIKITLDTPEDLRKITFLLERIYDEKNPFTQEKLTSFIDLHSGIFQEKEKIGLPLKRKSDINSRLRFR